MLQKIIKKNVHIGKAILLKLSTFDGKFYSF